MLAYALTAALPSGSQPGHALRGPVGHVLAWAGEKGGDMGNTGVSEGEGCIPACVQVGYYERSDSLAIV